MKDLSHWLYLHGRSDSAVNGKSPPPLVQIEVQNKIKKRPCRPLVPRGCMQREGFKSLVGRDVAFALLMWEYLVFERRWILANDDEKEPNQTRQDVWQLRKAKYTGAGVNDKLDEGNIVPPGVPKGSAKGFEGFLQAADEVHRLLGGPDQRIQDINADEIKVEEGRNRHRKYDTEFPRKRQPDCQQDHSRSFERSGTRSINTTYAAYSSGVESS
jgi:hypothetical protein